MKPIYLREQACARGASMGGRIQSIQATSTEAFVESFDRIENDAERDQIFISRYPQSRLLDLLDISEMKCYWLSLTQGTGTIEPSLEKINHFLESSIRDNTGNIYFEGMEWLISLHGFDAVHSMLRTLSERVSMSEWSVYISISGNSLDAREMSRFYREVPLLEIKENEQDVHKSSEDELPHQVLNNAKLEMDLNDDGTPKLVFLTKLPRSGFSKSILQRRILQWRRMGLDTVDIEASLFNPNVDEMYSKYLELEENVRKATELERYVLEHVLDSQERTIALFRIRQLTGLDELESFYFSD
tara:strand:+ start:3411 stop:4313 length:903 start_codon:yes stop_codon:yes gene_type:complete